jgi:hypothetical protein
VKLGSGTSLSVISNFCCLFQEFLFSCVSYIVDFFLLILIDSTFSRYRSCFRKGGI